MPGKDSKDSIRQQEERLKERRNERTIFILTVTFCMFVMFNELENYGRLIASFQLERLENREAVYLAPNNCFRAWLNLFFFPIHFVHVEIEGNGIQLFTNWKCNNMGMSHFFSDIGFCK